MKIATLVFLFSLGAHANHKSIEATTCQALVGSFLVDGLSTRSGDFLHHFNLIDMLGRRDFPGLDALFHQHIDKDCKFECTTGSARLEAEFRGVRKAPHRFHHVLKNANYQHRLIDNDWIFGPVDLTLTEQSVETTAGDSRRHPSDLNHVHYDFEFAEDDVRAILRKVLNPRVLYGLGNWADHSFSNQRRGGFVWSEKKRDYLQDDKLYGTLTDGMAKTKFADYLRMMPNETLPLLLIAYDNRTEDITFRYEISDDRRTVRIFSYNLEIIVRFGENDKSLLSLSVSSQVGQARVKVEAAFAKLNLDDAAAALDRERRNYVEQKNNEKRLAETKQLREKAASEGLYSEAARRDGEGTSTVFTPSISTRVTQQDYLFVMGDFPRPQQFVFNGITYYISYMRDGIITMESQDGEPAMGSYKKLQMKKDGSTLDMIEVQVGLPGGQR